MTTPGAVETASIAAPPSPETNKRVLKAIVLGPVIKDNLTTGETKELPQDELSNLINDGQVITPPFDKLVLAQLLENSTELGQVIEAMKVNCDGFGQRMELRVNTDDKEMPADMKMAVLQERARLANFFRHACVGHSFTELRTRTRSDIESTGEAYWEVIRTTAGQIVGFNHIPSYQISLAPQDKELTPFTRRVTMIQADGSMKLDTIIQRTRFRKMVQSQRSVFARGVGFTTVSGELRWFKEYQDPRVISNKTGKVWKEGDPELLPEDQAAEMIHFRLYTPRSPYGLPRYIGNLITIYGDRAADEVNFVTLKNNNIPSMVLLVSNGQLTEASIERINQFVISQIQGSDNYSRFLLIEAEGQYEGTETSNMKLDIKPLTDQQMRDQLFQEYSKNNRDKIRGAFRIPPIFVGRSEDYTRATVDSSTKLADQQVFSPERDKFDELMNERILPEMGVLYHNFVSNGPNVTADDDLIAVIDSAERSGGMTPRMCRRFIADITGVDEHALPPLDPSVNPDMPFSLQVAEAVKNQAEPSHQLAVKSMGQPNVLRLLQDLQDELRAEVRKRKADQRRAADAVRVG